MSTADGRNSTGKRKKGSYFWSKRGKFQNPKRGAPGFLFTCETSREFRSRREGFQILEYYWNRQYATEEEKGDDAAEKQSFEEELAELKKDGDDEKENPFVAFETGCRGVVLLLKREERVASNESGEQIAEDQPAHEEDSPPAKKLRQDDEITKGDEDTKAESKDIESEWNPLEMVHAIFQDGHKKVTTDTNGNSIPGSRYIMRIIPIQKTCGADIEEIRECVETLLSQMLESLPASTSDTVTTFAIQQKRRICGHLKGKDLIESVANQVSKSTTEKYGKPWKVDLGNPDYTFWIEACKSICGISIIPRETLKTAPNFNIAEMREKREKVASKDESE